jgi:hypothetical protein
VSLLLLFPATAGAQHTHSQPDGLTVADTLVKAAARATADTASGTDLFVKAARRTTVDTVAGTDQLVKAATKRPADVAQASDQVGKHLVALRPLRPTWEQ